MSRALSKTKFALISAGRLSVVLVVAATLLGCATSGGPPIASLATVTTPPAGQSRIIVMRPEKGLFGIGDRALPVKIDGEPMGDLLTGNYVSADRPAGRHQISVDLWDLPGVSRHDLTTVPGRVYYFTARVKEKVNGITAAAAFGGLAGYAVAAAASDDGTGSIDLIPMSEADAKRVIAQTR
jgi:uncharacterized protein DUF2846